MNLRKLGFAITMTCSLSPCYAADQAAQVMEPVHHFFDALGRQDKSGMLAVVAPNVEITSVQQGELRRRNMDSLAEAIAAHRGGAIAEHIHDPLVHIDNDLAVVWAPYKFTLDGHVNHCGTDVLTLARIDGRWIIIGLSDSERKENCQ
ncbi:nuclear transport factor 2 family protein [Dyella humi]|uniref:Nuclear transport factor 2 family protein n=1 Tax=Dyella humi TaxID=1770547 RepID=A0ABW8ILV6_9GAMM